MLNDLLINVNFKDYFNLGIFKFNLLIPKISTKNKKPCNSINYKALCGVDGATIEHLIPILTFFDSLKL